MTTIMDVHSETTSLGKMKVGDRGTIKGVEGSDLFRRRILEMGLVPGETVQIVRVAPMGDPIIVNIQGYQLGLRGNQSLAIKVELKSAESECTSFSKNASNAEPIRSTALGSSKPHSIQRVALLGNPNCGKTTLFNALTGLRQKVGNYAGVTVEKRVGKCRLSSGRDVDVLDLPGTYSLCPTSPDERITVDVVKGHVEEMQKIDGVIVVLDASNLARNLLLYTQLAECGLPLVVVLTMVDTAERRGRPVNVAMLERHLGVPVVAINAKRKEGLETLKNALLRAAIPEGSPWKNAASGDKLMADVGARYVWIAGVMRLAVGLAEPKRTVSDQLDQILVHRVAGLAVFTVIMTAMFYMLYIVADPLMQLAQGGITSLGEMCFGFLDEGPLKSLILDGAVAGVGGIVVFVPQIAVLFLCISLLEESGYLARAAFLLDRLLASVGLHGKSFIPMLSAHACAIPGIMAARSIENQRDRLATMFVAPFMSCGARLPVYALLIGVFLAPYGALAQSLTLFGCYSLGILMAILVALVLKKTALKEPPAAFLLELPSYQCPVLTQVLRVVLRNSWMFISKAGTVILGFSILLWAALYYPRLDENSQKSWLVSRGMEWDTYHTAKKVNEELSSLGAEILPEQKNTALLKAGLSPEIFDNYKVLSNEWSGRQVEQSWAGRGGKWIEPLIAPLGYDWKIGIGLIGAFAAREVFVSTMGVVYSVGENNDEESTSLRAAMVADRRSNGAILWTLPTVFSVLVFFVIAMQCMSTIAVMRQETGGWKWPLIQIATMNTLAYILAMAVYQIGTAIS